MKTRAWLAKAWGEPESMEWAEIDLPEPGPGQVCIRGRAAGLNFFDILQVQGKYQFKPPFPFTPGAEISGEIAAIGTGVSKFRIGDRVLAISFGDGLAEHTVIDAARVFPIPNGMDWPQAAAMPIVYHTSHHALIDRARLQPREWLLVHAGASGVGMAAIQLARTLDARIIATAGSQDKLDFARRQGAEHVVNYRDANWVNQVKQLTSGRGANVIFDPVSGDIFDLSTRCIAPGGRVLIVGFASGRIPSIAANRVLLKDISIVGVFWGSRVRSNPAYAAETQRELDRLWTQGKIRPEISSRYPLSEAPRAMRDLAQRKILGKAVLLV
jgi:NADPH2:quinone reductase